MCCRAGRSCTYGDSQGRDAPQLRELRKEVSRAQQAAKVTLARVHGLDDKMGSTIADGRLINAGTS